MSFDMEFSGFESVITSGSDLKSVDSDGCSSLEQYLHEKSFEPRFNPLEQRLMMDITEDHCHDLDAVNSWLDLSSMSDYSKWSPTISSRVVKSDATAENTTKNAAAPITDSSQFKDNKPTIFIKTDAKDTPTNILGQAPLSQSDSCTTVTNHVTGAPPPQSFINSCKNEKQQSTIISSFPFSHITSRDSPSILAHSDMLVQTPQILTSSTPQPNTVPDSTNTMINAAVAPSRYINAGESHKDQRSDESVFPKPPYSYACLSALALKNSITGSLPVSEIYSFICEHFPYFRTAPKEWKNSVRHNLSHHKCFEKIELPIVAGNDPRKGCSWVMNPTNAQKMDEHVWKCRIKYLIGIKNSMQYPEILESLERGEMKFKSSESKDSCSESSGSEYEEEDDEEVNAAVRALRVETLIEQLMKILMESPNCSVNVNQAADILKVRKRQLRHITLILEGAELIYRPEKNCIKWCGFSDMKYLVNREIEIDGLITCAMGELMKLKQDKNLAYVTRKDLDMAYSNKTVMGLKVPPNTTMKVPEAVAENDIKLYFQSEVDPIQLFIDDEFNA